MPKQLSTTAKPAPIIKGGHHRVFQRSDVTTPTKNVGRIGRARPHTEKRNQGTPTTVSSVIVTNPIYSYA